MEAWRAHKRFTEVPKPFVNAEPGAILEGSHFVQEDSGQEIRNWMMKTT